MFAEKGYVPAVPFGFSTPMLPPTQPTPMPRAPLGIAPPVLTGMRMQGGPPKGQPKLKVAPKN